MSGPHVFPVKPRPPEPFPDFRERAGADVAYLPTFCVIVFLRWFFQEAFPEFHWELDSTQSKLEIVDNYTTDKDSVRKKPIIVVRRGTMSWQNTSIDRGASLGVSPVPLTTPAGRVLASAHDLAPSTTTMIDLLSGRMTIDCISAEGLRAGRLASYVFMALRVHRNKLKQMGFLSFDTESIGSERLHFFTSTTRWVSVPVLAKFTLEANAVGERIEDGLDASGIEKCNTGLPPVVKVNVCPDDGCRQEADED